MDSQSRAAHRLAQTELFANIPPESLRRMFSSLHLVQQQRCQPCPAGHEQLSFVLDGRVRLARVDPDTGDELTLFLLSPGDCFDVVAALGDEDHAGVVVVAVDDVTIVSANRKAVDDWLDSIPEFRRALLPYLARQMHSLSELAADLRFRDTQTRLARLILNHVEGPGGSAPLIQDLSHDVLASMIGSVRQVVNRHLQQLRQEGAVEFRRGYLKVRDLEILAERATTALRSL